MRARANSAHCGCQAILPLRLTASVQAGQFLSRQKSSGPRRHSADRAARQGPFGPNLWL